MAEHVKPAVFVNKTDWCTLEVQIELEDMYSGAHRAVRCCLISLFVLRLTLMQ